MDSDDASSPISLPDIVARFEEPLLRYAARIAGDLDRARDAVQETFLALHREAETSRNGHLVQWLYTVCRRKALDVRRKEQRMPTLTAEQSEEALAASDVTADPLERGEATGQLLALLARLPDNQQEVIRLKFQANLSYRQIAEVTSLSETNVGYLLHMGLRRLRELMHYQQ